VPLNTQRTEEDRLMQRNEMRDWSCGTIRFAFRAMAGCNSTLGVLATLVRGFSSEMG